MKLDPSILARIQFAFTVSFHIIFPTMSIGLASFLAVIEALWLKTKNPVYLQIYRFWLNIFAMGFGIGVVTGIVLSFEFGLGFARFAQMAGPAIGPLIALEVLTAFFLEAGFLGIMLFGFHRVGPKLHFFATCMVAVGTLLSASWILSANSWMQTPAGVAIHDGQLTVVNWFHVLLNPSWPYRLPHMLTAAYLTASFMVAGVGAWYLLCGKHQDFARRTVALGTAFATVLIAGQVFIGDLVYGTMLKYQPSKMQAAEGFWEKQSQSPAPYYWFIIPDQKDQRNRFVLGTPYLGSIWLTHSLNGRVEGLKNTPRELQPRMALVFYAFRIMYCLAMLMFIPRDALQFSMVSLDAGFHDPIRDYCDIGGLVCCRDWTTTMGHLWHPENCRRSISCSFASSPVDSDRVRLRLRRLHHCLPDLYIPDYSPRPCGSSCLRRSVWFYKERIPPARARQSETIGE